jgi:uncharacterized peroxidase-related enzyme
MLQTLPVELANPRLSMHGLAAAPLPSLSFCLAEYAMTTFNVPTRDEVSPANQAIFDQLQKGLGFVPNLYAAMAYSDHALANYLAFQNSKSSINGKAREVVNLVVSEVNHCQYCLAAHTTLGKKAGLTDEQILEVRGGKASFDRKLDALARLVRDMTVNRGRTSDAVVDTFFAAGWTKASLVDAIIVIGDKTVTNYLHATTQIPVDWPAVPALDN